MEALSKELAEAVSESESFWADMDEELKDTLKKKEDGDKEQSEAKLDSKVLKEKYQEVMKALSNEATRKYAEYLKLKPKQKVAYQEEHTELTWPDASEKGANGAYKLPAIKSIIEEIKIGIEIPEDEDDYKIRYLYLLGQRISALKKQIKEVKTALDIKAREAIVSLTDEEIKALLREKWLSPIMQNINSIPSAIVSDLTGKVRTIIRKYENPIAALDSEIEQTERALVSLFDDLSGDSFDSAAIAEMIKLLGGDGE